MQVTSSSLELGDRREPPHLAEERDARLAGGYIELIPRAHERFEAAAERFARRVPQSLERVVRPITVGRPMATPVPSSAARMTARCTGVQLLLAHNAPEPHPLAPSTPRLRREATASPSSWYPSEAAESRHGKAARLRPAVSWMSSQPTVLTGRRPGKPATIYVGLVQAALGVTPAES